VTVRFTPSAVISRTGLLSLATNAGAVTVTLAGTGVQPAVQLIPGSTNWGAIGVASDSGDWLTVKNNSGVNVLITAHDKLSGPPGMWAWQGDSSNPSGTCVPGTTVLAPGASCVTFFGVGGALATGQTSASDRITYQPQSVGVSFTVAQGYSLNLQAPQLDSGYPWLDTGSLYPGQLGTAYLNVINYASNGGPFYLSQVYVEPSQWNNWQDMSWYRLSNNCNSQVPPGGACTITVQFSYPYWDRYSYNFNGTLHVIGGYHRMTAGADSGYMPNAASVNLTIDTYAYIYTDSGNDGGDDE
jgi:hypothetical protein